VDAARSFLPVLRDRHVRRPARRRSPGLRFLRAGPERRRGAAFLLRGRYDTAVSTGIIHNRLRGWDTGNHPGYALGTWLRDYKEQVFLFTRQFAVSWTNNVSERGAKAAKRHQAVSGYWHSLATLARWCRLRSYLDTAAAHGVTALNAIRDAIVGKPWLPPLPAIG
jgi:transposase